MKTDMDAKDLAKLLRYIKKAPRKFQAAATMWVNRAAFGSRKNILTHIRSTMIVRNDSFVKGRVRVQKARGTSPNREAIVGSVRKDRFTGWAEQERVKEDTRKKILTPAARGGNRRNVVRPSARVKPGKNHPKPSDYAGRTRRKRANTMLQVIGHTRSRKPFLLMGHRTLPAGLWRFGSGPKGSRDLEPLQLFGVKPKRPKRNPWMQKSVDRYFRRLDRRKVWAGIIRRVGATPALKK